MVIIRYLRVGIMILTVYDHNTTILILWGVLSYQLSTQGPLEIRIRPLYNSIATLLLNPIYLASLSSAPCP